MKSDYWLKCPKIGKLGQQCLLPRFHKGSHKFPPHSDKKPGQAIRELRG